MKVDHKTFILHYYLHVIQCPSNILLKIHCLCYLLTVFISRYNMAINLENGTFFNSVPNDLFLLSTNYQWCISPLGVVRKQMALTDSSIVFSTPNSIFRCDSSNVSITPHTLQKVLILFTNVEQK